MATQAKTGKGTKFSINGVLVGERTKISLGGRKIDLPDASNMDSPVDSVSGQIFKEYISGLAEGGDWSVDGNFVPGDAGQVALLAAFGVTSTFVVEASDSTWSATALGIIESHNYDFEQGKPMTFSLKVKITGNWTTTGF